MASVMKRMKTGDMILFSVRDVNTTRSNALSRATQLARTYVYRAFDGCEWHHAEMVYRDEATDKVYLMQCGRQGPHSDLFCGAPKVGVQCVLLEDKVRNMPGYCVWKPLNRALDPVRALQFVKDTYHYHYYFPTIDVLRRFVSTCDACSGGGDDGAERDSMFCTEWIGALYESCGVFDTSKRPLKGYYFPSDFDCDTYFANGWRFLDGCELDQIH